MTDELTHVWEELDQLDAIVRDYARQHYDLNKARQHIQAAMKIIQAAAADLATGATESLDLSDMMIVENKGQTLESLDEDCEIMGVALKLDEACVLDFDKHIAAITGDEDARLNESKKHRSLSDALSNQQEYDRRYKEKPGNRIKIKR